SSLANLNTIAPLISNFYLASYALINFCTFHAALIKPLGWRPTFKTPEDGKIKVHFGELVGGWGREGFLKGFLLSLHENVVSLPLGSTSPIPNPLAPHKTNLWALKWPGFRGLSKLDLDCFDLQNEQFKKPYYPFRWPNGLRCYSRIRLDYDGRIEYYNTWLSLVGFILCVSIMFMIDWVTSLITFIIIFALYLLVVYRKPDVNWGSSTQAQTYKTALMTAHRLNHINEHVKNYRPQILVLSGRPYLRPALVDLANLITKSQALMVCGDISEKRLSHRSRGSRLRKSISWFENHKIRSFFNIMDGLDFENGARALIQASGIGKLKPNVVMIGFKNDWQTCNTDDLLAYFNILHNTFDNRMAVAILRLQDGLDYTKSSDETDDGMLSMAPSSADLTSDTPTNLLRADSNFSIMSPSMPRNDSENSLTFKSSTPYFVPDSPASSMKHYSVTLDQRSVVASPKAIFKAKKKAITEQILSKGANGSVVHSSVPESMSLFRVKQKHGTIDVWWLYDDGGLTILLPYIINSRSNW
ncbi:unnamed protein product, partial [Timema podura]|nr:unnamed protein product [Timema podura]